MKRREASSREKSSKENTLAERDQFKKEVADLRKDYEAAKRLHPILEFYGPHTQIVRSYDLRKEAGSTIVIGPCPKTPCFIIELIGIEESQSGSPLATLAFKGTFEGGSILPWPIHYRLDLKRGCYMTFSVPSYRIRLVIEDDRVQSVKAGIGISADPSSSSQNFLGLDERRCPDE